MFAICIAIAFVNVLLFVHDALPNARSNVTESRAFLSFASLDWTKEFCSYGSSYFVCFNDRLNSMYENLFPELWTDI